MSAGLLASAGGGPVPAYTVEFARVGHSYRESQGQSPFAVNLTGSAIESVVFHESPSYKLRTVLLPLPREVTQADAWLFYE